MVATLLPPPCRSTSRQEGPSLFQNHPAIDVGLWKDTVECGDITSDVEMWSIAGLGWRDASATNLFGKCWPLAITNHSRRKRHNSVTLAFFFLNQRLQCWDFILGVEGKWQIRSYVTCFNTTGSVGCQCWTLFPFHYTKWQRKSFSWGWN